MRRVEVSYIWEVKAITDNAEAATVYTDPISGKFVVEFFVKKMNENT